MLPMLGLASLSLALVAYGGAGKTYVSADTLDTNFIANVTDTLTVTIPGGVTPLPIAPSGSGTFDSRDVTVVVNTNNVDGYQLGMLAKTTDLVRTEAIGEETPSIPTLSNNGTCTKETGTDCSFGMNSWGYNVGGGDEYLPVAKSVLLATSDSAANNDETALKFGIRLNNEIVSGSYSVDLTFVALANTSAPVGFEDAFNMKGKDKIAYEGSESMYTGKQFYKMQDMNGDICNAVTTPADAYEWATPAAQLIDVRDNNVYWVAKLLDGKCWMTQNLDFDITGPLTSETTNLVAYDEESFDGTSGKIYTSDQGYSKDPSTSVITWTPNEAAYTLNAYRSDIEEGNINSGPNSDANNKWKDDNNAPHTLNVGKWYETGDYFSSADCHDADSTTDCSFIDNTNNTAYNGALLSNYFSETPYGSNGTHGAVGNYYNWTAAIASNNTDGVTSGSYSNSVCPAGWSLPQNGMYGTLNGEYNKGYTEGETRDSGLFAAPLYFVRGGVVSGSEASSLLYDAGRFGYYWSSTANSTSYAYSLDFRSSNVDPARSYNRSFGRSVRCVAL